MRDTTGLEGVVVAETTLSEVDGERGALIVCGHPIGALSGVVPFEGLCALMWDGTIPDDASATSRALGEARAAAFEGLGRLGDALGAAHGMDALRAAVAHLPATDAPWPGPAVAVTGAMAVHAAAWSRRARGLAPVAPDPSAGHATDLLRMIHGRAPHPTWVGALDAYLATVVDHGMNASTFAARVVASTESDLVSAVVAALGALKGRLHGGAPGPVLDMLDAVGAPERAESWLRAELEAGRRIMGMGHRVYRVRDPRAAVLERALERLDAGGAASGRLALARAVERTAERLLAERKPDRPLRANVEFYTATLLEALELPRALFTPIFATSRVAGWSAHVEEQRRTGRLIRPRARYVGPRPRTA
ncbi:MAG TPA: citrate synthase [Sandaracinaceae bacterium LLY-WYZ-13_1]|nr:citrate synthase [Sandaracinaceae bacterium LLY-WYZ-13_1]